MKCTTPGIPPSYLNSYRKPCLPRINTFGLNEHKIKYVFLVAEYRWEIYYLSLFFSCKAHSFYEVYMYTLILSHVHLLKTIIKGQGQHLKRRSKSNRWHTQRFVLNLYHVCYTHHFQYIRSIPSSQGMDPSPIRRNYPD